MSRRNDYRKASNQSLEPIGGKQRPPLAQFFVILPKEMKSRRIIGLITITAAIPHIGFMIFFIFANHASITHWIVIEKLLIGITSITGGVLLWREGVWGHRLSIISWTLILFASLSALYVGLFHTSNVNAQIVLLTKDIVVSLIGTITLFILVRDLIKLRIV